MKAFLRYSMTAAGVWAACAGTLLAQQGAPQSDASNFAEIFRDLEPGKLAIILIFGSGIIATLGYSIAGIIRALNGSREDSEDMAARIDELEDRIERLEAQQKTPVQV
jgi:TolA-binding protein